MSFQCFFIPFFFFFSFCSFLDIITGMACRWWCAGLFRFIIYLYVIFRFLTISSNIYILYISFFSLLSDTCRYGLMAFEKSHTTWKQIIFVQWLVWKSSKLKMDGAVQIIVVVVFSLSIYVCFFDFQFYTNFIFFSFFFLAFFELCVFSDSIFVEMHVRDACYLYGAYGYGWKLCTIIFANAFGKWSPEPCFHYLVELFYSINYDLLIDKLRIWVKLNKVSLVGSWLKHKCLYEFRVLFVYTFWFYYVVIDMQWIFLSIWAFRRTIQKNNTNEIVSNKI